jgi:hypothetical protein
MGRIWPRALASRRERRRRITAGDQPPRHKGPHYRADTAHAHRKARPCCSDSRRIDGRNHHIKHRNRRSSRKHQYCRGRILFDSASQPLRRADVCRLSDRRSRRSLPHSDLGMALGLCVRRGGRLDPASCYDVATPGVSGLPSSAATCRRAVKSQPRSQPPEPASYVGVAYAARGRSSRAPERFGDFRLTIPGRVGSESNGRIAIRRGSFSPRYFAMSTPRRFICSRRRVGRKWI